MTSKAAVLALRITVAVNTIVGCQLYEVAVLSEAIMEHLLGDAGGFPESVHVADDLADVFFLRFVFADPLIDLLHVDLSILRQLAVQKKRLDVDELEVQVLVDCHRQERLDGIPGNRGRVLFLEVNSLRSELGQSLNCKAVLDLVDFSLGELCSWGVALDCNHCFWSKDPMSFCFLASHQFDCSVDLERLLLLKACRNDLIGQGTVHGLGPSGIVRVVGCCQLHDGLFSKFHN